MGARKGQNNFKSHQDNKVVVNKALVKLVLKRIKKSMVFSDVQTLVAYVAEKTKLHVTTITRNPEYMRAVLDYFGKQPGAAGIVNDEDANSAVLRAKLIAANLRIRSLEVSKGRLERSIARLLTGTIDQSSNSINQAQESAASETRPLGDLAFANTAMAFLLLLERLTEKDLGISLNTKDMQLVDASEIGSQKVIVGPDRLRWFVSWLTTQSALGSIHYQTDECEESGSGALASPTAQVNSI